MITLILILIIILETIFLQRVLTYNSDNTKRLKKRIMFFIKVINTVNSNK